MAEDVKVLQQALRDALRSIEDGRLEWSYCEEGPLTNVAPMETGISRAALTSVKLAHIHVAYKDLPEGNEGERTVG